jgi:hypothetical protein
LVNAKLLTAEAANPHTGGPSPILGSRYYQYYFLYPKRQSDETWSKEWARHLEKTANNPIMLVDDTWIESYESFFPSKRFGCFWDTHVEMRRYRGLETQLENWE